MLRREADGVRWWVERMALRGEKMRPASLVLAWVTRGGPADAPRQAGAVAAALEREPLMAEKQARRMFLRGYWPGEGGTGSEGGGEWTDERYRAVLERVAQPDGQGIDLAWRVIDRWRPLGYGDERDQEQRRVVPVTLSGRASAAPRYWEWTLSGAHGLFRDRLSHEEGDSLSPAGEAWARLLRLAGGWPQTLWGAVLHDYWQFGERLPYERYFGVEIPAADTAHTARGYYWANLLTEGHLAELGGAAAAARCAELGLAFEPAPGGRDAAVVRAAESVAVCSDQSLHALRELLAPVLRTVPYRFYAGPPLRVLAEPGTAFRWIPPDVDEPRLDDDPGTE